MSREEAPDGEETAGDAVAVDDDSQYQRLLDQLRRATGVDFRGYRDTTIRRRIMRRMVLHAKAGLKDYVDLAEEDKGELEALYQDILINVTSFFREPETFETLKERVFPEMLANRSPSSPVRIWVPGCSTGQEAYTLAMVLLEYLEAKNLRVPVQIFATDLSDSASLQKASEGLYPENIEAEVTPERLRRFFTREDDKYRITKSVRDLCVFAKQNVAADPPFSRMDLISCRNLLIYLAPPLQKRVLPTFHYALNPQGYLILGASETVGSLGDLFAPIDSKHRIYARKTTVQRQYPNFHADDFSSTVTEPQRQARAAENTGAGGSRSASGRWLAPPEAFPSAPLSASADDIIGLRRELSSMRDYLQSVIEQQDAANEELRSANEEILSSNEELQSANEELESAKEELTTTNEQLQKRNAELGRLNDDITNLLAAANVPMVSLGVDLRIRRFTPAAGKLLNLLPTDVGRPISDLSFTVEIPDVLDLVSDAVDTVRPREREVRGNNGHVYQLRVHPYRTADNRIDGAVIVLGLEGKPGILEINRDITTRGQPGDKDKPAK